MPKYIALYISLIVWRSMGGVIFLGSLAASLLIVLTRDKFDVPVSIPIITAGLIAGIGAVVGVVLFSLADYFETAIDTAEHTKRISDQLDVLIKKGADHE